ncbi:hypothetical protein [Nisaea nitritireducens]|uniref:hypothetical protein n=1 Tax=Nisaea nitritireducens TaxID=568392 RepID=UPI001867CDC6|nr:hypothetical protein [Nisaea nitritireducens]
MKISRYLIELGATFAAYVVALLVSNGLLTALEPDHALRPFIALLPMLPAAAVCWSVIRQVRRVDEMQRMIQFEALAIAFAATALSTFSYGFLESVGFPKLSMFAVWPLMAGFWIVGGVIARRRYR